MFANPVHASQGLGGVIPQPLPPAGPEVFELRRLADQLRESEERFRGLFEDAPVACHDLDAEGVVLRVNQAECQLFGFEPSQIVGRHIWEFMVAEDSEKTREGLRRRVTGEDPLVPLEREYNRRDGTTVILEVHQKTIRDAAGAIVGLRSFLLDITERKRAERTLQRQAEELTRSNTELEQFAYIASHDLQEPLRKILTFGDRLNRKYAGALGADGLDYLARMGNAAARMQNLIHDLLSLSRVASHTRPFAAVDLAEVARTVVSDLEARIEELGGRVDVAPLPAIFADRMQMAQLLQNLIGNALKFHKPGETPVVTVHSELGGLADIRIVVEDNGIGFDEKYLDKIFQVFQRLHGRSEYEGTGIGLAICRKIAERHGGGLTARSTPGTGAKFIFTLPSGAAAGDTQHE